MIEAALGPAQQPHRRDILEHQTRLSRPRICDALLERGVRRILLCHHEPAPHLNARGAQRQSGENGPRIVQASCSNHRNLYGIGHLRHQTHGGGLLPAVVSSGLEPFRHNSVHPS